MAHPLSRQEIVLSAILISLATLLSVVALRHDAPADLMATYLAGQQFAAGNFDQIYPPLGATFDLSVPESWRALAEAHGLGDMQLYPFIYPPIWAALAGKLSLIATPVVVFQVFHFVNALLLSASLVLSWRIVRPSVPLHLWVLIGLLVLNVTVIGFIAQLQGQPQIIVSFLIVLAIERSRTDHPVAAGAALALAAAIKLYPLLFVVIWLARGNWRAIGSFAGFGLLLGTLSLALGGVELHLLFLQQVAAINDTVILTNLSFNLNSLLSQFFLADLLTANATADSAGSIPAGMHAPTPPGFGLIDKTLLLATIVLIWMAARKASTDRLYRVIWPVYLILVSLFSPLSWAYHFISAAVFFPALILSGPRRPGFWLCLTYLAIISIPSVTYLLPKATDFLYIQASGTLGMAVMAALFLWPSSTGGTMGTPEYPNPANSPVKTP